MCCLPQKNNSRKEMTTMKNESRTPLTFLEACTLMAREAVSLLEGGEESLDSGVEFREALALLHSTQDLGDGGALLAWVDHELESATRFVKTGERTECLVKLDTPLPLPDPAAQLDTVWMVLSAAAHGSLTEKQWQTTLNAVRSLTEMDGLEDMVLCTNIPDGGFLTADDLRNLLGSVQTALAENQKRSDTETAEQAMA